MTSKELVEKLREHADWAGANEWEAPITLGDDLRTAADVLEAMRWVPVTERLPEPKDEYGWVDCIVTVMESRWPRSTYDVIDAPESRELIFHAKFDCFQKIWHVAESAVNALIGIEDAPLNGWTVTHWMPLPRGPEEVE